MLAVAMWSVMIAITISAWLLLWYVPCLNALLRVFLVINALFPIPNLCHCRVLIVTCLYDDITTSCVFSSIPALWPFLALYLIWVRWIDDAPEKGGRSSQWFRSSRFWRYFADYYPAS